jgi:hypothetical protein
MMLSYSALLHDAVIFIVNLKQQQKGGPSGRQLQPVLQQPAAWWPGCQAASAKKQQSRVQRPAYLGIPRAIHTTPTGAMEALTGLPPLDLIIQGEARSAAYCLWSLGCWFYLNPS